MEVSGQLRETSSGIHWIGGWAGPRAGLDACPYRESNPGLQAPRGFGSTLFQYYQHFSFLENKIKLVATGFKIDQNESSSFSIMTRLRVGRPMFVSRQGQGISSSPPPEVKYAWSYTSTPKFVFMVVVTK
jgi:hypothetical protein